MAQGNQGGQNPFDALRNLGELKDIRKLLGPDFFKNLPLNQSNGLFNGEEEGTQFPQVDLMDYGSQFVLWMDIPGLSRTDFSLNVSSYAVHIRGLVPSPTNKRDENHLLVSERFYGSFEREIELPARVHTDSVKAAYQNGVLKVTIQKVTINEDDFNHAVQIDFD